jgi:hypothetical protein
MPANPAPDLIAIPFVDARDEGPLALLKAHKDKTADLIAKSRDAFGWFSRVFSAPALPIGDRIALRWLRRTGNPYREEIEQAAKLLGIPGVIALNMSYEWGCTSGAFQAAPGAAPLLARILDWPFPALGDNTVVALQKGPAGEFHNVTWPGVAGVFQAVAKGRFAAALNQAPMRRHRTGIFIDWLRNRFIVNGRKGLPPAHLLRKVFETARSYDEAKAMLATEPVALPVIYILAGTKEGEGCVIERIEAEAQIREMRNGRAAAANHFESAFNGIGHGWLPRATDSHGRALCATTLPADEISRDFSWFKPPMANSLSRLAMVADAGSGAFKVIGTAGVLPVTDVFRM